MVVIEKNSLKDLKLDTQAIQKSFKNATLEVGFFENARYPNGTYVASVAKWQELGTIHIPPRPFMRPTIENKQESWVRFVNQQSAKGVPTDKIFAQLGELIKGQIITKIGSVNTPPLKKTTIKAKGSSKPLIDTGIMRRSVTYVVS